MICYYKSLRRYYKSSHLSKFSQSCQSFLVCLFFCFRCMRHISSINYLVFFHIILTTSKVMCILNNDLVDPRYKGLMGLSKCYLFPIHIHQIVLIALDVYIIRTIFILRQTFRIYYVKSIVNHLLLFLNNSQTMSLSKIKSEKHHTI